MKTKNITESNLALTPSAVKIEHINIFNHNGKKREVKNICVKVEITESVFTPYLILKLEFTDATNLIESFPIIGQERVDIKLSRKELGQDEEVSIDLPFAVTKYPTYGKGQSESMQLFTLEAISNHAYRSNFKKISRSYSGTSTDQLKKIFSEDLEMDSELKTYGDDVSRHRGIINTQTPLQAAEKFRQIAYDGKNAPFYLYQLLNGELSFISLSNLFGEENPIYKTYVNANQYSSKTPNDAEGAEGKNPDYEERKTRILDIASNLNLSKYNQSKIGAWASRNEFLDWSDKSSVREEFDYNNLDIKLEANTPLSDKFTVFNKTLNKLPEQHLEHISINNGSFDDEVNFGIIRKNNIAKNNAFSALMNTYVHDIKLFGDFYLNAGRKIELKFPKAVDPEERETITGDNDKFDNHLSGKYIITSAIHTVEGGEYYTDVRVKRDSFSLELGEND